MITLFLLLFVVLMLMGVPIAFTLGGAALFYIGLKEGISLTLLPQTTYAGMASFPLLAIPLFMLAGRLMHEGGITADLVRFARVLLGHVRGGLGLAMILSSAVFAAISGSAVATAAAIGAALLPVMKEQGYDNDLAAAVTATAACMGPIIPPSIPFIIYGVIANVSIAELFLAGVLPGLLLGISLMLYMAWEAKKRHYPAERRASLKEVVAVSRQSLPALFMPVMVMGGILGGVFTPTEAAGMAVLYAFLADRLFYRRLQWRRLPAVFLQAGLEAAVVMLLIGLCEAFTWVVAVEQLPARVLETLTHVSSSPYVFLILVNLFLLVVGVPLETAPALIIMAPILAPMAAKMGIDAVHFGVVVCFNLVLGLITPPVGAVLFTICGISGLTLEGLSRAVWRPFLIAVAVLAVVTFLPALSTALPRLFFR
ncbi:MAG: TRAP transporter large permease subunit [Syntrophales bacterium]|nr:TRAP transporter large permease subunit [Syntrophales bacterium]